MDRSTNEISVDSFPPKYGSKPYTPAVSTISSLEMADILGDTIASQPPPLTVGLFGKWGSGKSFMLRQTRERMEEISSSSGDNKDFEINIVSLIYRLFFFYPVLNSKRHKNAKFLFIDFSILDYAGSDKLWAGVLTHISNAIDEAFGKWAVKIFRTWHYRPNRDLKVYLEEVDPEDYSNTDKRWIFPPLKAFVKPFVLFLLVIAVVVAWLLLGVSQSSSQNETATKNATTITITTIVVMGATLKLPDVAKMGFNLMMSQVNQITRMSKKADFSASLGFMGKVKKEIFYLTSVIRYMSVFLDKEIRVCLSIDDIDLLSKEKIMDLFQVVSLLQMSRNSVYIQILAMDPMTSANLIKKALTRELYSNISGHSYLKKYIQLPFHIPPLNWRQRSSKRGSKQETSRMSKQADTHPLLTSKDVVIEMEDISKLSVDNNNSDQPVNLIEDSMLSDLHLSQYIDGNERALNRVIMSSEMAIRMMTSLTNITLSKEKMKKLIAWITFADQWPYRISWIHQIVEDNLQLHWIDSKLIHKLSEDSLLEDVYQLASGKLSKPEDWKNLLELDGDPETFITFLHQFPFTIKDMNAFLPFTTNLNNSLLRIIAHCSAKLYIQQRESLCSEASQHRWWHHFPLERWSTEDVCLELEQIGLSKRYLEQYKKTVMERGVTGSMLSYASLSDLRDYFDMNPGDWYRVKHTVTALRTYYGVENRKTLLLRFHGWHNCLAWLTRWSSGSSLSTSHRARTNSAPYLVTIRSYQAVVSATQTWYSRLQTELSS